MQSAHSRRKYPLFFISSLLRWRQKHLKEHAMSRTDRQIPYPETRLNVIKRFLHVLALLQNDEEQWNATSLADILTLDEGGHVVSDKNIRDSIAYIEDKLEIGISTQKGSKRTMLEEELSEEMMLQLAVLYASFIISDSTGETTLKNFLTRHSRDGLWMLARLHFACLERKKIRLDYTSNRGHENKGWEVYACHLVFRTVNLYLLIQIPGESRPRLLIANRIENLEVLDDAYDGEVKSIEELFNYSLSGYIVDHDKVKEVSITYDEMIHPQIEQFLASLEPEYTHKDGKYEAVFMSADDLYLCKQFLMYGKSIEIVGPSELRARMVELLEESLSVYTG